MFNGQIDSILELAETSCDLDDRARAILKRYLEDIGALLMLESTFTQQVAVGAVKNLFLSVEPQLQNNVVDNKIREFWAYSLKWAKPPVVEEPEPVEALEEAIAESENLATAEPVDKSNKTFLIHAEDGVTEIGKTIMTWDGNPVSEEVDEAYERYLPLGSDVYKWKLKEATPEAVETPAPVTEELDTNTTPNAVETAQEDTVTPAETVTPVVPQDEVPATTDSEQVSETQEEAPAEEVAGPTTASLQGEIATTKFDAAGLDALNWPELVKLSKEEGFDGQVNKENITAYLLNLKDDDENQQEAQG